MSANVDFSTVVPASKLEGEDASETRKLKHMVKQAADYLRSFNWCSSVEEEYFGLGVGDVVAVCLFRIDPSKPNVDEWLWVVVGDLPSAYLVTDCAPNPAMALNEYIRQMQRWVRAVKAGQSTSRIIPVNVAATQANAEDLESRLVFLKKEILLKHYEDQLKRPKHRR